MLRSLIITALLWAQVAVAMADMRRTISETTPLWLFHVDVWSNANPQAIIDLVPEDMRPYVAFNLSVSSNKDRTHDGMTLLESWLSVCAQNRVWATCQVASGGYSHLSDTDLSQAEHFFETYPNFLGFNYAEQYWGFDTETGIGDGSSPTVAQRYNYTFATLLEMASNYGGYLFVSNCKEETNYNSGTSVIQVLKDYTTFTAAAQSYADHLVYMEKHTSALGFYGMESQTLGMWLAGYCGHYGMRWDECGYEAKGGTNRQARTPEALGGAIMAEHMMFTGQTVQDGPELTWRQCIATDADSQGDDGFTQHNWSLQPAMTNVYLDLMRKWIAEGAYRIMSRSEVIDSTKVAVLNDLPTTTANGRRTADNLFDLYQMDDGIHEQDTVFTKKTGRYPCIPTLVSAENIEGLKIVKQSEYETVWPTTETKRQELDRYFGKQSDGDMYVRRLDNVVMLYNPYTEKQQSACGTLTPQYNSVDEVELRMGNYSFALLTETADGLSFYMNNYRTRTADDQPTGDALFSDTITISGCAEKPAYNLTDRGSHTASTVAETYSDGTYRLVVAHHGPLDLDITCQGQRMDVATVPQTDAYEGAPTPNMYDGTVRYEAEDFDYIDCESIHSESATTLSGYSAMGYVAAETQTVSASTGLRNQHILAPEAGRYTVEVAYQAPDGGVYNYSLRVNGNYATTLAFSKATDWTTVTAEVNLQAGENTLALMANTQKTTNLYIDYISLTPVDASDGITTIPATEEKSAGETWYNLGGQRVDGARGHGVYIVNKRKVVL